MTLYVLLGILLVADAINNFFDTVCPSKTSTASRCLGCVLEGVDGSPINGECKMLQDLRLDKAETELEDVMKNVESAVGGSAPDPFRNPSPRCAGFLVLWWWPPAKPCEASGMA